MCSLYSLVLTCCSSLSHCFTKAAIRRFADVQQFDDEVFSKLAVCSIFFREDIYSQHSTFQLHKRDSGSTTLQA
ncbi:hypothetical protein GOP47_0011059 [Adiantum capillus-veneris]|uniref:Secreted protein n=1 Tax=Adiantum capillus-veneris TaxID=13818 RepID=A0A9D4ZHH3_ADICA|nr:hypothetical protein GOP47_0011059 [Adiantum capillus-veneris]